MPGNRARAALQDWLRRPEIRSHLPSNILEYLRWCVTIDTRSLAAFRIFAALLIIGDVLSRSRNFHFYYTDDGAVSQELAERFTRADAFSIFFYTSDPDVIAGLFILHVLIAFLLLIGYKTRIALIISFLFVVSLDYHNPFVLSYADTLFRMLLFWSIFLPLGERWSIDALQRDRPPRGSVAGLATFAIMTQMIFMYFVNAMNKFPSDRWHSGDAAIIVMGIDEMTYLIGNFMRNFPVFLQIGGRMWFYLLVVSPLLLLLYGRARYPMLVALAGGHLSFALTVRIGAFAYVALVGLLVFVQPRLWADIGLLLRIVGQEHRGPAVRDAIAAPGGWVAARLPGRLVDFTGRDLFARKTLTAFVAVFIIGIMIFPAFSIAAEGPYLDESPLPDDNPIEDAAANLGVNQPTWSIFAGPGPRNIDRFYVMPAVTADGTTWDVYNDRALTADRPGQNLQHMHSTYRERFYMNSVRRHTVVANAYVDHVCAQWNEQGIELTHVNIHEYRERITIDTVDAPEERERWLEHESQHACGEHRPKDIEIPD